MNDKSFDKYKLPETVISETVAEPVNVGEAILAFNAKFVAIVVE